jgi:hypothetical protein
MLERWLDVGKRHRARQRFASGQETKQPEVDRPSVTEGGSTPSASGSQAPPEYVSTASPYDECDSAHQVRADEAMVNTIDGLTGGDGLAWAVYLRNAAQGLSSEGVPAPKLHPGVLRRLDGHVVALRDAYDDRDEEGLAREKLRAVRVVREIMAATIHELNRKAGSRPGR